MMQFRRKRNFDDFYENRPSLPGIGTEAKGVRKKSKEGHWSSESASTSMQNTSVSQLPLEIDIDPLLKDIVFSEDLEQKKLVNRLYRDIYYNDPVCGSAVDLFATLPFSEFTFGGVTDRRARQSFAETIERLNCRTLMPHISTDHLVDGAYISSLLFNKTSKRFFDTMPHRFCDCKVDSLPFYSQDPIITAAISEEVRGLFSSDSTRLENMKERLGSELVELLSNDAIELDSISTVYVPRKIFTTGEGVSWYRRILPIWLIEKNLFRGTLVESSRRQRGILHLELGDGDQWEPTIADMEFMTELFMNADADPLGAIIATRMGVQTNEIRQGGDFWKVTDIWDSTAMFKMRALGISETFLSGETNLATADNSMTLLIETIRTFRDMITRKFFYDKLFPLISLVNGYTINDRGKLIRKDGLLEGGNIQANLNKLANSSRLLVPTIHWNKQLKPEGDQTYIDMLSILTEKGIPVPLRAFAAAGGFNLDNLLNDADDDLDLLKRISEYRKKVDEVKKKHGPAQADDGGMGGFASSGDDDLRDMIVEAKQAPSSVLRQGTGRSIPLDARDFDGEQEIVGRTRTGKKKYIMNQRRANEKANKDIARALTKITKHKKTSLTHRTKTPMSGDDVIKF